MYNADEVFGALATLYGTEGPTEVSLVDDAFLLKGTLEQGCLSEAEKTLVSWLDHPLSSKLVCPSLAMVVRYVSDSLFLEDHFLYQLPLIYTLEGTRAIGENEKEPFTLFVRRKDSRSLSGLPKSFSTNRHPASEAALNKRFHGWPSLAYEEHVQQCRLCFGSLSIAHELDELPPTFAELFARVQRP